VHAVEAFYDRTDDIKRQSGYDYEIWDTCIDKCMEADHYTKQFFEGNHGVYTHRSECGEFLFVDLCTELPIKGSTHYFSPFYEQQIELDQEKKIERNDYYEEEVLTYAHCLGYFGEGEVPQNSEVWDTLSQDQQVEIATAYFSLLIFEDCYGRWMGNEGNLPFDNMIYASDLMIAEDWKSYDVFEDLISWLKGGSLEENLSSEDYKKYIPWWE
jgi:hypothetical protein